MASSDRNKHLRAGRGMLGEHAADSSRSPREEILRVPYGNLRDLVTRSIAWAHVLARHMHSVAMRADAHVPDGCWASAASRWTRSPCCGGSTRMSILAWIVIGLLAGWIASMIMHGGYGIIGDLVLGILGALISGWVTGLVLGRDMITGFNIETLVVAIVGAMVLIAISRLFTRGRAAA